MHVNSSVYDNGTVLRLLCCSQNDEEKEEKEEKEDAVDEHTLIAARLVLSLCDWTESARLHDGGYVSFTHVCVCTYIFVCLCMSLSW